VPPILPPQDGFLFLDRDKFHASFAADLSAEQAAFMADSQVPWGVEALSGAISEPAWRSKPSWYLVATEDRMIPPPAQREMSGRAGATIVEAAGRPLHLCLSANNRRRPDQEGCFRSAGRTLDQLRAEGAPLAVRVCMLAPFGSSCLLLRKPARHRSGRTEPGLTPHPSGGRTLPQPTSLILQGGRAVRNCSFRDAGLDSVVALASTDSGQSVRSTEPDCVVPLLGRRY
jgi:hypothetical protein